MAWTVCHLVEANGNIPHREFLASLSPALRGSILGKIKATAEVEGQIGGHIFRALHTVSGLFEVRAMAGIDLARSLCCRDGQNLILLNGVKKRCEEPTPDSDINEALRLRKLYFETKKTEPPYQGEEDGTN